MKKIGHIAGSRIWQLGDWEPSLERTLYEKDDFLGDVLKDGWTDAIGAGCTAVIVPAVNGTVALTTVVNDDLFATIARELNYSAALACGIEARLNIDVLASETFEMGFCDVLAAAVAAGTAFDDYELTGGLPTPDAAVADAVVIGFDPTDSPLHPHLTGVSANSGAPPDAAVDLGVDPATGVFVVLKVQLDAAGNASYYVNGALLGTQPLAIEPATLLTPWLAVRNKAVAVARILTVDYIKMWQNR